MNRLVRLVSLWLCVSAPLAHAACVAPIAQPEQAERSAWDDLLGLAPDADLNPVIAEFQDYRSTGTGALSLDYYSLTFDDGGRKPSQWMNDFRVNIDKRIFTGTAFAVKPFDSANAVRWSSSSPKGAVMVFDLAPPPERGAVVVSCKDSASFVFTSVHIDAADGPGDHPISGHRGFGFVANGDGSITFFSKGVGRVKSGNATAAKQGAERMFELGASTWSRMLGNLREVNARRNPRDEILHRRNEEL